MKLRELLSKMKQVQEAIGASEPYICGGTPRDRYLGHLENIADLDITTGDKTVDYLSQEFEIALRKQYKVTRTTANDGHSTIHLGDFKMDFSSNFNAPNIDQLLAQKGIAKPNDMQREMFSRDFTCNALLLSLDLKQLSDPTNLGFKDIKEKMIRTCLAPEITLVTNKNRVIRAVYLASKLGFDIDPTIVEYVKKNPAVVKIATNKVLTEKLDEAFKRDPERATYYMNKMHLWDHVPITQSVQPYYMKAVNVPQAKAYFDMALLSKYGGPNYDYGDGAYTAMSEGKKMETITDASHDSPGAMMADDNKDYMLPPKEHGQSIYNWRNSIYQGKPGKHKKDSNDLDFQFDNVEGDIDSGSIIGDSESFETPKALGPAGEPFDTTISPGQVNLGDFESYPSSAQIGGYLDKYLPQNDFEDKDPSELDFGRDYSEEIGGDRAYESEDDNSLDELAAKYLNPQPNQGLFGLPDGVDLPDEDLGDPTDLNPDYGTYGPESLMYEDKWNI